MLTPEELKAAALSMLNPPPKTLPKGEPIPDPNQEIGHRQCLKLRPKVGDALPRPVFRPSTRYSEGYEY